jgi:CheY-like chemotaxis protein
LKTGIEHPANLYGTCSMPFKSLGGVMVSIANKLSRSVHVLLVEDNLADVTLIMEAFKECQKPIQVTRVKDGEDALRYLKREERYSQSHRPDLILLDLNIPRKTGLEVLNEIKSDPQLNEIPVVILTNSKMQTDVQKAYESRANFYIVKPTELDGLFAVARYVEDIWLKSVDSPED